jgi:hypothetical protein
LEGRIAGKLPGGVSPHTQRRTPHPSSTLTIHQDAATGDWPTIHENLALKTGVSV